MSHVFDVTEVSDDVAAAMWKRIDWKAAERRLRDLQRELTDASENKDHERELELEEEIVRDLDFRCLAVRHVRQTATGPGVDRVRWRTDADCFRAACTLTAEDYRAQSLRQVDIVSRNNGKVRHIAIPTYRDKAMAYLYHMVLAPQLEAQADSGSFAFRRGRSAHDALALLRESLGGPDAPGWVVVADVEAFYSNIVHGWVMKHVPMDKHVLHEQIKSGVVYTGRLFERGEEGISESSSLSTEIANHILNGLQGRIFTELHGRREDLDWAQGSLVRFADDIVVTARSHRQAERILRIIEGFVRERGLYLSRDKTGIFTLERGFTFLSETFRLEDGRLSVRPSEDAVERFVTRLEDTIVGWPYSHARLIDRLNRMLAGWANYHRYYDAYRAFERVDFALLTMLLRDLMRRCPDKDRTQLKREYFCRTNGTYQHCLKGDPSVRVMSLRDVILVRHRRVRTSLNAYRDVEYLERRRRERDAVNVSGDYKGVWRRQRGRCAYCRNKILADQPKALVTPDPTREPSLENAAYVHVRCLHDEHEVYETFDPLTSFVPFDTLSTLEEIVALDDPKPTHAKGITERWKYMPLKRHFSQLERTSATLTFEEIEGIVGQSLPEGARKSAAFWRSHGERRGICDAWETEDWELDKIDLKRGKARFKKVQRKYGWLKLPKELTEKQIPADANYLMWRYAKQVARMFAL